MKFYHFFPTLQLYLIAYAKNVKKSFVSLVLPGSFRWGRRGQALMVKTRTASVLLSLVSCGELSSCNKQLNWSQQRKSESGKNVNCRKNVVRPIENTGLHCVNCFEQASGFSTSPRVSLPIDFIRIKLYQFKIGQKIMLLRVQGLQVSNFAKGLTCQIFVGYC